MPKLNKPKETSTRIATDTILANLGWRLDEALPDCNVFTERCKTAQQNKLLLGNEPDYVLYRSNSDQPIAVIEAKRGGQSMAQALADANRKYAEPLSVDILFVTDRTIVQSHDRRTGLSLRIDDEPVTDFLSEKQLLRFIDEGPDVHTSAKITLSKKELIAVFADANELLRKEGLREGVERFTEFSNLLFLKLISEIEADRERCIYCQLCEKECDMGVPIRKLIKKHGGIKVADCVGCGRCIQVCPKGALRFSDIRDYLGFRHEFPQPLKAKPSVKRQEEEKAPAVTS